MENSFQTSFIPKKPVLGGSPVSTTSSSSTNITMTVSFVIFFIMILSAGGLYLYKNFYLIKNKEALSANLFKIRDSFDKDTIAELEMYDKSTTVAKEVLSGHIVLSPLFEAINDLTLSTIQYTRFEHTTVKDVFSVKMSGIARDYKSIALEADVFNNEKKGQMFKDVIFSNLTKDKNNFVTFDVEFNVDPSLLSYANNITNNNSNTTPVNPTVDLSPVSTETLNTNQLDTATGQLPASNNLQ